MCVRSYKQFHAICLYAVGFLAASVSIWFARDFSHYNLSLVTLKFKGKRNIEVFHFIVPCNLFILALLA